MIIVKIFVFILMLVFMLGVLSGVGLLGFANIVKRQMNGMMGDFARGMNQSGEQDNARREKVETADVVMEECPKCGTFTEKNNHCEACGYSW